MDSIKLIDLLASDKVDEGVVFLFLIYAAQKFLKEMPLDELRQLAQDAGVEKEWAGFEVEFLKNE